MRSEIQNEPQTENQSLVRMLTLAIACVVWMGAFLWYYSKIDGMRNFLMAHRAEHPVYEFLASTFPWGGEVFIGIMLVFLLSENTRPQTQLYKTGINIFFVLLGVGLFVYVLSLLPRGV
ncbi:hypothetical protein [Deinococcus roseus]|uniref:DUF1634 domain-containing protein n=1 Tax=Deinococcus roseus TaxID=392414 RepID=A0ABQ2D941_9DEIO|nr:hypothetical protein [Deinococcus roseus]GGJ50437.1 hypothetical protein GCM10008938_40430 [Deinococcus roseus]